MTETTFEDTGDMLLDAAREMGEGLTLAQVHRVQQYAKLYARWKLQEVAMEEHRRGRHTLAQTILARSEAIK